MLLCLNCCQYLTKEQVRGIAEEETFKVIKTGSKKSKAWKRMITKATFVGESFTRKPVKLERFIRPTGLRFKKAHVTHRECLYLSPFAVKPDASS